MFVFIDLSKFIRIGRAYPRVGSLFFLWRFGQLIRENNKALDKTFIYCYDNIGNITSVKTYAYTTDATPSGTFTEQAYGYSSSHPDRLTNFGGKGISYNTLGCPINHDGMSYVWTKGKLTRQFCGSKAQAGTLYKDTTFTYDAYGRRLSKIHTYDTNPASSSDYSYTYNTTYDYDSSGRLVHETCVEATTYTGGSSSTREITYLYDESGIIGAIQTLNSTTTDRYYFDRNLRGDVIAIYNNSGTKIATYSYDSWGNCTTKTLVSNNFSNYNPIRYRGYYYDRETKLYYLNARYYNPQWRRFISPDDTSYLDPENPNGLNLYAYCGNDPINKLDPSGHFVITTTMILAAIGIGAAIGAGIGFGAAYVPDVIDNIKNDGFQWSDFNTFENNWLHYVGATLGGAISGAGIGLCSVLGAGLGVALSAGTALSIGGTAISGGTALALGIGGAYVTGGLGYAVRTGISNQENFDLADMFIDATSNAISGMLTFGGALVGGIVGIKVPGSEFILKYFVLYHLLATSLGVYPLKAILAFIKSKLKESN